MEYSCQSVVPFGARPAMLSKPSMLPRCLPVDAQPKLATTTAGFLGFDPAAHAHALVLIKVGRDRLHHPAKTLGVAAPETDFT